MKVKSIIILACIWFVGCNNSDDPVATCSSDNLLDSFITQDGIEVFIYENGDLYTKQDGNCVFELQYFDPQVLANAYLTNSEGTFIVSGNDLFPTKNSYIDNFDTATSFEGLFVTSLTDIDLFWTSFTLQSPLAPLVEDYVALRKCILDGTCTFKDNKIELAPDPTNGANQTLKFTSVAHSIDMVTAKASISSQLHYFIQGSDLWFEADYYIESGVPFSIVDFESGYFEESPGPRVVLRNGQLEIENKFGAKLNYENQTEITIPSNQWFTVKVHLKYSAKEDGVIELWQDGQQLISATGITFPLSNAIIDRFEFGVTATPEGCIMYVDNMRVSDIEF